MGLGIGVGTTSPSVALDVSGAMNINGRISNSSIPAFRVQIGSNWNVLTSNSTILFTNIPLNTGLHYTSGNGRFTAPYPGLYFFSFNLIISTSTSAGNNTPAYVGALIFVNENGVAETYDPHTAGRWSSRQISTVVYLNTNDYVTARVNSESAVTAETRSQFSGYYIG